MSLRTDLISEKSNFRDDLNGVTTKTFSSGDTVLQYAEIKNENAAKELEKPMGKYYTVKFPRVDTLTDFYDIEHFLVTALDDLLPDCREQVMVVGLGNRDITPDSLGPLTADGIIATRHISNSIKKQTGLESLRAVSSVIPGVLGKTGIEASIGIKAISESIKPTAVIVIDALAAQSPDRLCTTFQLTNTGISPGSGVNNARKAFDKNTFGVPVIAIGMPTVIDYELNENETMMVTPKDIDMLIKKSAKILSDTLNGFLQPDTDKEILTALS
ncbi:MAG: GPR endopeptidase [Clostridia bacterium]|nr:GPR endopeptidase [Clostridia bacterium]